MLLGRIYRANPAYELVLFDRLPADQQVQFSRLRQDPDFYGLLEPRESSGLRAKSVSRDTALLFLTLRQPGPLPAYVGEQGNREAGGVAELVLDGVLEVASESGFVSGAAAHGLLLGAGAEAKELGRIGRLSLEAVRYGAAVEVATTAQLSGRLYLYNGIPASAY